MSNVAKKSAGRLATLAPIDAPAPGRAYAVEEIDGARVITGIKMRLSHQEQLVVNPSDSIFRRRSGGQRI